MMRTLIVDYQWEDETVMEKTGHQHAYAEAKNLKYEV